MVSITNLRPQQHNVLVRSPLAEVIKAGEEIPND